MQDPGPLRFEYANVSVGAATTVLATADANRKYLAIFNRSDEQVDVMEDADAVLGEGTPLAPTASTGALPSFHEWSQGKGNFTQQAINGICTSGTKTVTVKEGF